MPVRSSNGPLHRKGQPLDLDVFEAEMGLSAAGGETSTEDFQLPSFPGQTKLHGVLVDTRHAMSLAGI